MHKTISVLTSKDTLKKMGDGELTSLETVFGARNVVELIHELPTNSIVIPRFRAIPFGDLLEQEVAYRGCELINTFRQHRSIADSSNWAHLLDGSDGKRQLTPTQYGLRDIPYLEEGEWFVKGETNSLRDQWLDSAYAPTTKDLSRVVNNLMNDSYVGNQRVVIKPFQKYRRLTTGLNSQPIFHERRAFILDGQVLTDAPYWSSFSEAISDDISFDNEAYLDTLTQAVARVEHIARFIVLDMAEFENGEWGVVELNDGCMSGLSENKGIDLWSEFLTVVRGGKWMDSKFGGVQSD